VKNYRAFTLTNNNRRVIIFCVVYGGGRVYAIVFYKDGNGRQPVADYIKELGSRRDKDSRVKLNKINDYITALKVYGTQAGEPYVKHLDGEIWELRPIRDRVLFAAHTEDGFVMLHHFMKKTQKTPQREIERAKRELEDFRERARRKREEAEAEGETKNESESEE
jgi:phage-related protein